MRIVYKVVELNVVTDETLQDALNLYTAQGWHFEGIHFVVRESSRRPSMAFVAFIREEEEPPDETETQDLRSDGKDGTGLTE